MLEFFIAASSLQACCCLVVLVCGDEFSQCRSGQTPFVSRTKAMNWATGVDLSTGRPQENPAARYSRTGKAFVVQPGPQGAHSWHPMSFDPRNGLLYIPAMLNSAQLSARVAEPPSRYALNTGADAMHPLGASQNSSRLIAWDPTEGRARWSLDRKTPEASGVLATAGGLLFQGTTDGSLQAMSTDTGQTLWRSDVGAAITAAPMTYAVGGTQMIAVIAGSGGAGLMAGGQDAADHLPGHNTPRLVAFSLRGTQTLPKPAAAATVPWPPPSFGTSIQLDRGMVLYERYCARCHGGSTINAGPLKDLRQSERLGDPSQWRTVVFAGLLRASGMPGFMAELTPEDSESVRAYVVACAHEQFETARRRGLD